MRQIRVNLFGRLTVQIGDETLGRSEAAKVLELFCFLLLFRERPYAREALASLFWSEYPTALSKKYLRQTIWKLQNAFSLPGEQSQPPLLLVEADWVQVNPGANLWLDIAEFDRIYQVIGGIDGRQLAPETADYLKQAVSLYRGDLLEGWYQDWCLYERERYQTIYLALLDKLMAYCQAHGEFHDALAYGAQVLRQDHARERTHRQMMRLRLMTGDRTGALRQFEACQAALRDELNVSPSRQTLELYQKIRNDEIDLRLFNLNDEINLNPGQISTSLRSTLDFLQNLQITLASIQEKLEVDIHAVEGELSKQESS
jgi:DNA-binding SARP family transcriptional activator